MSHPRVRLVGDTMYHALPGYAQALAELYDDSEGFASDGENESTEQARAV